MFIRGDFNTKYNFFEFNVISAIQEIMFAWWSANFGLDFIKKPGVFIYCIKYIIDLIFVNILFVESRVCYDLDNGLNHFMIIIIIPDNSIMLNQYSGYKIKKGQFKYFVNLVKRKTVLLPDINILNIVNEIDITIIKFNTFL